MAGASQTMGRYAVLVAAESKNRQLLRLFFVFFILLLLLGGKTVVALDDNDDNGNDNGYSMMSHPQEYNNPIKEEPTSAAVEKKWISVSPSFSPINMIINSTSRDSWNTAKNDADNIDTTSFVHSNNRLKKTGHILLIFVVCSVAVMGMASCVYVVSMVLDKLPDCYCTCLPDDYDFEDPPVRSALLGGSSLLDPNSSSVARKAHLWGMSNAERAQILPFLFRQTTFMWNEPVPPPQSGMPLDDDDATHRDNPLNNNQGDSIKENATIIEKIMLSSSSKARNGRDEKTQPKKPPRVLEIRQESNNEDQEGGVGMDDAHNNNLCHRTCCICLTPYKPGCRVMTGTTCQHMFHQSCCLQWLKQGHDHCPYCRQEMMTAEELRMAAAVVLGRRRVQEISAGMLVAAAAAVVGNNSRHASVFSSASSSSSSSDEDV